MDPLNLSALPEQALLLVDTAPIIYALEDDPIFRQRFKPVFEAHADGRLRLATTTISLAEVLVGPLQSGNEVLARRYRAVLESWQIVDLTADIAESAARLRTQLRLELPDAVQVASALAINADALVTHDRDFSSVQSLPILA